MIAAVEIFNKYKSISDICAKSKLAAVNSIINGLPFWRSPDNNTVSIPASYRRKGGKLKILDSTNNLEKNLKGFSNRKIQIVTAFASGTEDLLGALLESENDIEIVIGTINYFSSPKLIEYCQRHSQEKFQTYVDFRYESSVHWKLFLIEPNIVIIGSANFTLTGLSLARDTMTVIKNEELYKKYSSRIEELKTDSSVIDVTDSKFDKYFDLYREKHKRMQKARSQATQHKNAEKWLHDEANQTLPLFIWDSQHSKKTIKKAHQLIEESDLDVTRKDLKDFSTYECDENELPYEEGDVVLTASHKGAYIAFQTFDRIIYDDGVYYIYSFKKKRYKYPFKLDDIKTKLKSMIPVWYEEEVTEIHRDQIASLLN